MPELLVSDVLILVFLLVLSGFFSASEIAIFSLSPAKIRKLFKKNKNALILEKIKKQPQKLLITILIGNNISNILAASFATLTAFKIVGNTSHAVIVGIVTGVMTFLVLVFGEITPKNLAIKYNKQISLFAAPYYEFLMKILWPLIKVFEVFSLSILKVFDGKQKKEPVITEEEVNAFLAMGVEEGTIDPHEKELIHRVFKFNDITVGEIMTPRTEIKAIQLNWSLKKTKNYISENKFSRFPVYKNSLNTVEGILYVKDLLIKNVSKKNFSLMELLRPCLFVPKTKKLDALLQEFQKKKVHMAMIVNEFGGIIGLVTIEDLLEEIVGEIEDEKDVSQKIERTSNNTYLLNGKITLEKVNEFFKTNFYSEEYDTIAGFLMEKLDKIPVIGDTIKVNGLHLTVRKTKNKKILLIEIKTQ